MMNRCILLIVFAMSLASPSLAGAYGVGANNSDLRSELANDPNRLLPSNDFYALALDASLFKRSTGVADYYHGNGYWIASRLELNPHRQLALNLRAVAFNATSSWGYTQASGLFALASASWLQPIENTKWSILGRASDLGRQTLGRGLVIQNKEINGGLLSATNGDLAFRVVVDGTGAFFLPDDLWYYEISALQGRFGLGYGFFTVEGEPNPPFANIFTNLPLTDSMSLEAEAAYRNHAGAGLGALAYRTKSPFFTFEARGQTRYYGEGFAQRWKRNIQLVYVAYDQQDKDFTESRSIFTVDDDVFVHALKFDIEYRLSHTWRLFSNNEAGVFDYRKFEDKRFYFFTAGARICPVENRDDCLSIFGSNKLLSAYGPPTDFSLENRTLFREKLHAGLEASFRF